MSKRFKAWFMSLTPAEREAAAKVAGTNVAYLNKMQYTTPDADLPHFKARIAVGVDKASGGVLDFRDMMEGGRDIDWGYVRRRLNADARAR